MTHSLLTHEIGCTPSAPCSSCKIMRFLRENLTPVNFVTLETMLMDVGRNLPRKDVGFLEISVRASEALKKNGVTTIEQLLSMTHGQLLAMEGFGLKSLADVQQELQPYRTGEKKVWLTPDDHY